MLVVASSAVYLITALLEGTATKLNLIQKQVDSNGFDSRDNFWCLEDTCPSRLPSSQRATSEIWQAQSHTSISNTFTFAL